MELLTHIGRGLIGMAFILGVAYACSAHRRAIDWKLVGAGLALQLLLGWMVMKVEAARWVVEQVGSGVVALIDFNQAGARFLFGNLVTDQKTFGFLFAFNVLPTIVFFSAFSSLLFYLGILQKVVLVFAWVLSRAMKLSGAESLSASANIFLGQTEAPLLVRPYLPTMTRSELLAIMVGGMATIAGAVMAAYVGMLGGDDPVKRLYFAKHLLTASTMAAPCGLVMAKLLLPQTEQVNRNLEVSREKIGANLLEAIANGTSDGLKLAVNVGAMLLVFTAMIALFNALLAHGVGGWTGLNAWIAQSSGGRYADLSLQYLFGIVFAPVAWLLGVDGGSLSLAGQVIGEKIVLNEFYAYNTLSQLIQAGTLSDVRSQTIITYALCGFANIGSIGIQIGGIGALAPGQRSTLALLGVRALLGGTLACFMTATTAGMLL